MHSSAMAVSQKLNRVRNFNLIVSEHDPKLAEAV